MEYSMAALRQNQTFRQNQVLDLTQARDASRAGKLKRWRVSKDGEAGVRANAVSLALR